LVSWRLQPTRTTCSSCSRTCARSSSSGNTGRIGLSRSPCARGVEIGRSVYYSVRRRTRSTLQLGRTSEAQMKRVTGIGGIFFNANDPVALRAWYKQHLGIDVQEWGGTAFTWADAAGNP